MEAPNSGDQDRVTTESRLRGAGRLAGEIRLGVVGLGYWGPNLLRNAHEIEGIDAAVACDANPSRLESVARRYPQLTLTPNFDDVLKSEVDGVVIATPISTHFDLARRALLAGKHVLVEKPMAASVQMGLELRRIADEHGLVVMPGHTFLYSPPVTAVGGLLASGELGKIHFGTSSRVNLGIHQPDVSVIADLAPHDFSILVSWMGRPSFVRAIGRDAIVDGIVDVAFVDVGYDDGCLIHIDLSWLAPIKLRRTVLVGERKMVVYEDTSTEQVRVFDSGVERMDPQTFGEFQLSYRSGEIRSPHIRAAEPLRLELEDFATAIVTGRPPRSNVDLGLDVLSMMEAAEESLASGGPAVPVRRIPSFGRVPPGATDVTIAP